MIKVKARGNESVEQMVRRFKKMCEKEGLAKDIKRNSYYEKPSKRSAAACERASSGRSWASDGLVQASRLSGDARDVAQADLLGVIDCFQQIEAFQASSRRPPA